jgi:hypothetical protein
MNSETKSLGSLYRTSVRQVCTQYEPPADGDRDEAFLSYLRSGYEEAKVRCGSVVGKDDDPKQTSIHIGRFIFAAGLFAYGQLDVADDLLDYMPSSGGIRKLALVLKALLPLPDPLHPLRDPEGTRLWLQNHRDRLQWNEAAGMYELWISHES